MGNFSFFPLYFVNYELPRFNGKFNGNKLRSREKKVELLNCNLVFPLFFFLIRKISNEWAEHRP